MNNNNVNVVDKRARLILENYTLADRVVRIKGEDECLFSVNYSTQYKRSKKDADLIAKEIVKAVNNHSILLEALKRFVAFADRVKIDSYESAMLLQAKEAIKQCEQ